MSTDCLFCAFTWWLVLSVFRCILSSQFPKSCPELWCLYLSCVLLTVSHYRWCCAHLLGIFPVLCGRVLVHGSKYGIYIKYTQWSIFLWMFGACCWEVLIVISPVVLSKYLGFRLSRSLPVWQMAFLQTASKKPSGADTVVVQRHVTVCNSLQKLKT